MYYIAILTNITIENTLTVNKQTNYITYHCLSISNIHIHADWVYTCTTMWIKCSLVIIIIFLFIYNLIKLKHVWFRCCNIAHPTRYGTCFIAIYYFQLSYLKVRGNKARDFKVKCGRTDLLLTGFWKVPFDQLNKI